MDGGRRKGKNGNQCLTMHQPWASLLIHGIKRIEGRSWAAPIRGRLWIHAASKVPDDTTIKAMENFYKEIYAVSGITDLKFPEHYPVSTLLGCIEVVGCLRCEELACWKDVPEVVRLEGLTPFCWLCEQPQMLPFPFEMRGFHGIYDLDKEICDAAVGSLVPVESPLQVKFQLPNPRDHFSLKPGSVSIRFPESKAPEVEKSPKLSAAINAARAAAGQFSKTEQSAESKSSRGKDVNNLNKQRQVNSSSLVQQHRMAAADGVYRHRSGHEQSPVIGQFSKEQNAETKSLRGRDANNLNRPRQANNNSVQHRVAATNGVYRPVRHKYDQTDCSVDSGRSSSYEQSPVIEGQFSKERTAETKSSRGRDANNLNRPRQVNNNSSVQHRMAASNEVYRPVRRENDQTDGPLNGGRSSSHEQSPRAETIRLPGPNSKIFYVAVKDLRQAAKESRSQSIL